MRFQFSREEDEGAAHGIGVAEVWQFLLNWVYCFDYCFNTR